MIPSLHEEIAGTSFPYPTGKESRILGPCCTHDTLRQQNHRVLLWSLHTSDSGGLGLLLWYTGGSSHLSLGNSEACKPHNRLFCSLILEILTSWVEKAEANCWKNLILLPYGINGNIKQEVSICLHLKIFSSHTYSNLSFLPQRRYLFLQIAMPMETNISQKLGTLTSS